MLALARLVGGFAGAGIVLLAIWTLIQIPLTPGIADLKKAKREHPSVLVSVDGQTLASYKRFHREWVPLERISPDVVNALVATEDRRFYQHHGIDFHRLAGAALRTLAGRIEGGSTITQQLARNLYPEEIGRKRSINRKIRETITALKIEHAYTKREILETYLNTVPFLYNAYGIEMAARTYFDKPAAKLTLLESATLIGMLKGASYYNPVFNPERSRSRRNVVLAQMSKAGKLAPNRLAALQAQPLGLDFERQLEARGPAPHFAEFLRRWLIDWADRHDYNIYADGLKIYTTIDSRLQAAANAAVKRQADALQAVADVEWAQPGQSLLSTSTAAYAAMRPRVTPFAHFWRAHPELLDAFVRESSAYRNAVAGGADASATLARLKSDTDFLAKLKSDKTRLEAGMVAIDPDSGDVKAWVGSRDFDLDQYDHVARAQRQPGSTFKPFVYGAALEAGIPPDRKYPDRVKEYRLPDGGTWQPRDIGPASGRMMSMAEGLAQSKNTITAQVMEAVGPAKAADFARRAGVRQSRLEAVPALALGTSPVTLLEMASSYATIAAGGIYRAPLMLTRIEDAQGRVLVEFSSRSRRELPRGASEELIAMLRGAIDHGTGQAIRSSFGIRADVAGKTGTTQDNTDGWFMLMHPRLVTGSWVGFDDARVTMRSDYWGQGSHNALLLVGDFFRGAANRRLIDVAARFPGERASWFGAGLLDWLDRMLHGHGDGGGHGTPLDALADGIRTVRESIERVQREWEALQRLLDRIRGVFS
ncbi:transglycosylase domain-containing protein [Noviherbaspirillum sp. DKR-6]|uniref:Transglycosylase domain-containing protein n=2 Tax=Noviherbaspirillum pedocola TaxID=2801341 RepID=A0A934SYJ0_9BURK|nr:transglycosylase domain-containing protein [Noviherbaspirillum pedocola]